MKSKDLSAYAYICVKLEILRLCFTSLRMTKTEHFPPETKKTDYLSAFQYKTPCIKYFHSSSQLCHTFCTSSSSSNISIIFCIDFVSSSPILLVVLGTLKKIYQYKEVTIFYKCLSSFNISFYIILKIIVHYSKLKRNFQ